MTYSRTYSQHNSNAHSHALSQPHSHLDNSTVRSRPADRVMWEQKEDKIRRKEKNEEVGRNKRFLINGVDFHK